MTNLNITRTNEKGNALFLILVAVILFAALSFAITQSNRSGANPNRETSLVTSTTITQYSTSIRTGVTRMLLRNVAPNQLLFNNPASFSGTLEREVFSAQGGGVAFQGVDVNTVETGGAWVFDLTSSVNLIGTAADDAIAFLTRVRQPVCQRIVDQIFGDNPAVAIPTFAVAIGSVAAGANLSLTGANITAQPFGCFEATAGSGNFVYYHVLAEQ